MASSFAAFRRESPICLVFERLWRILFLVVRSKYFLRFFFQPVHLHGELADFAGIGGFLLPLGLELLLEVVFSGVIEYDACLAKELVLPVPQEIWQDFVLGRQGVEVFLPLEQLDDQIRFEFRCEMTAYA